MGKLKGRSADELRVRGAQALAAASERAGLSSLARLPNDAAFFRLLDPAASAAKDAEGWLEHFRRRRTPRFFAGFDDEAATREALRSRFADEADAVVSRAGRVLEGRFDLLGRAGLDFGSPVDWHLEPLARVRAPLAHWSRIDFLDPEVSGDKKFVWELNRHQFFQTLGRAYWRTGDERYAEGFARYAAGWMDANPPKAGVNWASSLEVAFRSISWLWALHFFRRSEHLTPALFLRLSKFLHLHARHLETYLSTYFSPNTHLTGEALGLYYLGTLLPEFRAAARWREAGRRILTSELGRHVRPDGVYFEQATYYHRYTADFYLHFALLARLNGEAWDARLPGKLSALLDHLTHLTRPDGTTPFLGDDDGGRLVMLDERGADDFRASLSNGAALLGRADYKRAAGRAAEETLWLLGAEGLERFDALPVREPGQTSRAFPDGGYYVMRDGWGDDANYMLLDCGPHGAEAIGSGHAHADALSFVLSARGRTLLVDPGTYTYTGSREERDRFRSTAGHNALTLDGHSSSVPRGPFSWERAARCEARRWQAGARFDFFEGSHDGFARLDPPADYTRAVLFLKGDYWVVLDRVRPPGALAADAVDGVRSPQAVGARRCEAHFHFAPDAGPSIEARGDAYAVSAGGVGEPGVEILSPRADGEWVLREGWVSRCYGAREPAAVVTRAWEGAGAYDSFSFMLPLAAGAARGAELSELKTECGGRAGRAFELRRGARRDVLLVGSGRGGEVRTGEDEARAARVSSDFDWAWLRFAEGEGALEEFVVVGGRRLRLNGVDVVNRDARSGRVEYLSARREGGRWAASGGEDLFAYGLGAGEYSRYAARDAAREFEDEGRLRPLASVED
ncbi:MAG TPA: alginate lyase family protein [Pyrinomonadaceae bacterium]